MKKKQKTTSTTTKTPRERRVGLPGHGDEAMLGSRVKGRYARTLRRERTTEDPL